MDDQEAEFAELIYAAIQHYTTNTDRSAQSKAFKAGVSDLGYCSERVRRMLDGQIPEDTDMLLAFLGTAIGDHAEAAICGFWPSRVVRQAKVELVLNGDGGRTYHVPGHPDLIFPDEGVMLDGKTSYGLQLARRVGDQDQQKKFQRHAYGLAAWKAGYYPGRDPEDVKVGNFWIDRSGKAREVHVSMEPLDLGVIQEATHWLDDAVYAFLNGQEAAKEPPREVCAATCGFFRTCRAYDTDVTGLLTDPEVLEAVAMYREGSALEKQGKALKDEAKPALKEMAGTTGDYSIRWVHVNETEIPATKRAAYDRLDIKPLKK